MAKALWNGQVVAESDDTIEVENNVYFPPDSVNKSFLKESDFTTICPWKGTASYYTVAVDGKEADNAAWYYPDPKKEAEHFKNYIAFWRGVEVVDE